MRVKSSFFIAVVLILSLSACVDNTEETVPKVDYNAVVSELESTKSELNQLKNEVTALQEELQALKESIEEPEEILETQVDDRQEKGLTIATEPILVPDPTTQSEFIIELTAENFISVFEFKTSNLYDVWGEYWTKQWGFSSLLYEQGWALGKIEDFAVEYSVFGEGKTTETQPTAGKVTGYSKYAEDEEPELRVYRAKGTLTFYPIEDVSDEVEVAPEYDVRLIRRTLPDGSMIRLYTDLEGKIIY